MHGHVYVIDCNRIWEENHKSSWEPGRNSTWADCCKYATFSIMMDDVWCIVWKSVNSSEKVWFLPQSLDCSRTAETQFPGLQKAVSHSKSLKPFGVQCRRWLEAGQRTCKCCNIKTTMLKFHTWPQTKIWVRNSIRVMNVPSSDRWVTMQPVACLTLRCLQQNSTWFWRERCLIASFHTNENSKQQTTSV